jgi:uroporphyrinogen-III synthase
MLWPRAEAARESVAEDLRSRGARLDAVTAYRTEPPVYTADRLEAVFSHHTPDLITLTSGSTAENFVRLLKGTPHWERIRSVPCAVIGPVTKKEAVSAGLRVAAEADPHTVDGLMQAVINYLTGLAPTKTE